jgi:CRP/FNR family transcriptional regulator
MKRRTPVPHCTACGTRARGVFCSLTGERLLKFDRRKFVHEYDRGQVIFYEGNPPLALYCINSGVVKLYKSGTGDSRVAIRLLGPGEALGFRALLANEPYAATAEAVDRTVACAIAKETFQEIIYQDEETAFRFMTKLAMELRISEDELVSRAQQSVRQRTARFLLSVLEKLQDPREGKNRIALPLLREEMAQLVGTTPETFSRVLRRLSAEKILAVDRHDIVVANPRALRRIAEE